MKFIRGGDDGGGVGGGDNDIELIILMSTTESWTARGVLLATYSECVHVKFMFI